MNYVVLLAVFAVAAADDLKELLTEQCPDEVTKQVQFSQQALAAKYDNCGQLTVYDVITVHEASEKCPCVANALQSYAQANEGDALDPSSDSGTGTGDGDDGAAADKPPAEDKPKAKPAGNAFGADGCFSGDMQVLSKEHGLIRMADLAKLGNGLHVQAWNKDQNKAVFSPIKYWIHSEPQTEMHFNLIRTDSGKLISITNDHLIYRSRSCQSHDYEAVFAHRITQGDCLFVSCATGVCIDTVNQVQHETKAGIYGPLTEEGSIVVNGVAASCFVHNEDEFLQKLAYSVYFRFLDGLQSLLPSRIFDALFGVGTRLNENGYVKPAEVLLAIDRFQKYLLP